MMSVKLGAFVGAVCAVLGFLVAVALMPDGSAAEERWRLHCQSVESQARGLERMDDAQRARFMEYSMVPDMLVECRGGK